MSKSTQLLFYCLAFLAGIAIASFLPLRFHAFSFWFLAGSFVFVILLIFSGKKKRLRIALLLGLFLFLGLGRYSVSIPVDSSQKLSHYNGSEVTILGPISGEVKSEIDKQKFEFESSYLKEKDREVQGRVLVFTRLYPEYEFGEKLKIVCDLQSPEPFQGFAYDRYLAKSDIYSVCYYPKISRVSETEKKYIPQDFFLSFFLEKIYSFKDKLRSSVERGLLEPEGGIVKAMVLGDKFAVPDDLREDFARAGLSHLMAISGMHIGILVAILFWFLLFLGLHRQKAFYATTALLIFYVVLIGFPASAVRASIMAFLLLLSLHLGRLNRIVNALALAAVVMLLINPFLLRDDIGFQLSFLAVLGIVYFYPLFSFYLEKFLRAPESRIIKGIISVFSLTLAAQVLTLPLIAYNFSQVSLVSPLTNILVLWTLPFLLSAVLLALALSLFLPGFAFYFFLPAYFFLRYILAIVNYFATRTWTYLSLDNPGLTWLGLYYLVVILIYFLLAKYKRIQEESEIEF